MGEIILKVSPDRDLYAVWSSIVDDVVFVGTREEVVEERARAAADYARLRAGEALDRADRAGTSGQDGGWDGAPLLARGGRLSRGSLSNYIELRSSGRDAEADALITPMYVREHVAR